MCSDDKPSRQRKQIDLRIYALSAYCKLLFQSIKKDHLLFSSNPLSSHFKLTLSFPLLSACYWTHIFIFTSSSSQLKTPHNRINQNNLHYGANTLTIYKFTAWKAVGVFAHILTYHTHATTATHTHINETMILYLRRVSFSIKWKIETNLHIDDGVRVCAAYTIYHVYYFMSPCIAYAHR